MQRAKATPPAAAHSGIGSQEPASIAITGGSPDATGAQATATPRAYAKARFVWIQPTPSQESQWIGYLRAGGSVRIRANQPVVGPGCGHWYAVEPRGFVCVDGARATLDANDPVFLALSKHAPALDSPWPHQYAESQGAPLYEDIPSLDQQRNREPDFRSHMQRMAQFQN
ncbi:MAG TPA: L,D-transpeptidase, partial [Polyangiaceae bacterium]